MLIDSIVLQRPCNWRFSGLFRLHQWARSGPWASKEGGLALIRVNEDVKQELIASAVRMVSVYIHSSHVAVVSVGDAEGGHHSNLAPSVRVAAAIGISPSLSTRELRNLLSEHLSRQPTLFVVSVSDDEEVADLQRLLDWFAKSPDQTPFACIAWSSSVRTAPEGMVFLDLRFGYPEEAIDQIWSLDSDTDAFARYLYARIAWEAAGDVSLVRFLEQELAEEANESMLDSQLEYEIARASAAIPSPPHAQLESLARFLTKRHADARLREADAQGLGELGLLWRPDGSFGWMVPPWLTRRMCSSTPLNTRTWAVRRYMQCIPISTGILSKCLSLELAAREQLIPFIRDCPVPSAQQNISNWRDNAAVQEYAIYTSSHPCTPSRSAASPDEDVWLWGDLGDLLATAYKRGLLRVSADSFHRLNRVRNAIAHCHPPAWGHIKAMRRVAREVESY
jgi:hypothetical protein